MSASVLVVGGGGREHALAWKLSQSPEVSRLIVAPGNAGMPSSWERWTERLGFQALAQKALQEKIDLVVVGPDDPLADGIVDELEAVGLRVFGPKKEAARIESSKSFAKEIMKSAGIPTAKYWVSESEEEARKILRSVPWRSGRGGWVVKLDGLALGKGVRVCSDPQDAIDAVSGFAQVHAKLRKSEKFKLVIEERLQGEEISWMAFCDGERCSLLQPARDYKRLGNQDSGPNTGGMGSFSPVPGVPDSWKNRIREEVFLPALREMKRRGCPFRGLLYAGLMVDFASDRFWVLEFNARFGDPETQVLMARMEGDLYPWLRAVACGDLSTLPAEVPFKKEAAVVVIAASGGYPDAPRVGKKIRGPQPEEGTFFFAGVKLDEGSDGKSQWVTSGGRVLGALGMGASLEKASQAAYAQLSKIHFDEMQFRSDIGKFQ